MLKKFLAGLLTVGAFALPLPVNAADYDTSQLQNPQGRIFYLYSKKVDFKIEEQMERARRLIDDGNDYPMAIAVLNEIIEMDADASEAYLLKAFAYTAMNNYDAADKEYQNALRIEPENPTFFYFRGMNYLYWADSFNKNSGNVHNRADDGIKMFNKALEIEKKYVDAIIGVGDGYTRIGNYNKANGWKDAAVNNYNKAIAEYNKVLVWFPNNSPVLAKKAMAQSYIAEIQGTNEAARQAQAEAQRKAELERKING